MHVYQMRSSVPSIVATSQERISICMQALKDVSKVWLVAKMVHTLFESILGNKVLEERLQKAPGKRHQRSKANSDAKKQDAPKRKFEEMDIGVHNGGPTPPVSYERSRPQTPAVTPSRELNQAAAFGTTQAGTNPGRNAQDGFPGSSNVRGNTRPTTPFGVSYSMPATPPDLFLVTRNSPNLSPTLWENFQPDQLFPDGTNFFPPHLASPQQGHVDPQLQLPTHPMMMSQQQQQQMPTRTQGSPSMMPGMQPDLSNLQNQQQNPPMFGINNAMSWQGIDAALAGTSLDASSQDDNWSNSSRGGPTAPTTLNVEDWYVHMLFRSG